MRRDFGIVWSEGCGTGRGGVFAAGGGVLACGRVGWVPWLGSGGDRAGGRAEGIAGSVLDCLPAQPLTPSRLCID